MHKLLLLFVLISFSFTSFAQYPFEKHPAISYTKYTKWTNYGEEDSEQIDRVIDISGFYMNGDSLSVRLVTFGMYVDSSFIKVFRNDKLLHTFFEEATLSMALTESSDALYAADVNGDGLTDLKYYAPQPGMGIAWMQNDVIYLFQNNDGTFTKISFGDMFDYGVDGFLYRPERDFNGDNNYEIITRTLIFHENHSYWTYNLYNYIDGTLVNVNDKFQYPIMIQYLNRDNYNITNKISRAKMKTFSAALPCGYDKE